jgi:thioredoxin:protein disulfide reductase
MIGSGICRFVRPMPARAARSLRRSGLLALAVACLGLVHLGSAPAEAPAGGEVPEEFPPPSPQVFLSHAALPARAEGTLLVILEVADNFHIQINDFLEVRVADDAPITVGAWTATRLAKWHTDDVLKGKTALRVPFTVKADAQPGLAAIPVFVGYQGCVEDPIYACFPPDEAELRAQLEVLPVGGAARGANQEAFLAHGIALEEIQPPGEDVIAVPPAGGVTAAGGANPGAVVPVTDSGATATAPPVAVDASPESAPAQGAPSLAGRLEGALAKGSLLAFVLVFFGGILTSFTPCVYPMIPITISFVGGRARNRAHGFALSLFFVLGIAIMYSSLGLIAASTGSIFGSAMQSTALLVVVAAIFAAMGASMLGAFDLALPASMQGKMTSGAQRGGVLGAILMGMVTGLVASPCVGPVLVVLLTFVAKTGNLLFGFWLLFTFACGLGLLFLVLGTFASAINALPGAGSWMETVKHVFGVILIAMAIYYVRTIIGPQATRFAYGVYLVAVGVYTGALTPLAVGVGGRAHFRKALAMLLFLSGALLFLIWLAVAIGAPALLFGGAASHAAVAPGAVGATGPARVHAGPAWRVNDEAAIAEARAAGRPVMIDFYADWCAACVELDEKTWVDPAIITESQRFVAIKMDFTKRGEFMKTMQAHYEVRGMPTVIFFDGRGGEQTRFFGFKDADDVLQLMQGVK